MDVCATCGVPLRHDKIGDGHFQFCSQDCYEKSPILEIAQKIPEDELNAEVLKIFQGKCISCEKQSPKDVFVSFGIVSVFVMSFRNNSVHICCKKCGYRKVLKDLFVSMFLGWWGIPSGLIYTPIQIFKNIKELARKRDFTKPSERLINSIRYDIADRKAYLSQAGLSRGTGMFG